MKKISTTFILTIVALCLFACAEKEKQSDFIANKDGVSPILLNLEVEKIPASSDNLYDSFRTEKVDDDYEGSYSILHFLKGDKPVMDAYVYGNTIGSIEILSPQIASVEGISPGTKVQVLFDKGGKANMSNDGQLSIILGNLNFKVSGLKPAGDMKLQNAYATGENPLITAEDFESSAKVESIVVY